MIIELKNAVKSYDGGKLPILHDISLSVEANEFLCLIGPSGCGKSTLLKLIAGLEKADSGAVTVPAEISMVFQSGALLPWFTVFENVALGLRVEKKSEQWIEHTAGRFLDMVGLADFAGKYPRDLSGGQRQRVGLARALAVEPKALLLDEPFSALDPKTTEELHRDLLRIWKETNLTVVMVSHLIEEAVSLADRIVLMKEGRIAETFPVPLHYPRREQTEKFSDLVFKIRKQFFA